MAFDDVLEWSKKQPDWAKDALRRVVVASGYKLGEKEQEEVLARVKHVNGITSDPAPACIALSEEHLPKEVAVGAGRTVLCSISEVKNVNQLATDQVLPFATDGITLIYGDNGSGKSGYCRIAKKLCRSIAPEDILGNVFAEGEPKKPEAKVRYQLPPYTAVQEKVWQDGSSPPPDICNISIFDTENARLYVDDHNKIQYLPPPISLMESYTNLLRALLAKVEGEVTTVRTLTNKPLPSGYAEGSAVSVLLSPLNPTLRKGKTPPALPTEEILKAAAIWNDDFEKSLSELEKSLKDDPAVLAVKCQRIATTLTNLSTEMKSVEDALSDRALTNLQDKLTKAKTTKEAAALAATQLFTKEPVAHTGSDKWRTMYEYARAYAEEASDGKAPNPSVDNHCVLCQQILSPEAAARLKKFDDFIANKSTAEANAAAKDAETVCGTIKNLKISAKPELERMLGEYNDSKEANKANVEQAIAFAEAAKKRRDDILAALLSNDFSKISPAPTNISPMLDKQSSVYTIEAAAHKKMADEGDDRAADKKKLVDLKDQKKLSLDIDTFVARLKDLVLLDNLMKCNEALSTSNASKCVTALRKKLVTEDMRKRVYAEIKGFDLEHIPFDVSDKSRGGESLVGVELRAATSVENKDVLSEGEQRALALACFLSEVMGDPVKHGIIIDDPVSSLDHLRIRRVAQRLVDEAAAGRQVVIFTHNLVFYTEVARMAAEARVPLQRNCVRHEKGKGFGLIKAGEEPWIAAEVVSRIKILRERLLKFKDRTDTGTDTYRLETASFYTDLRETWERLVEELLLGKVVERFTSDVKTMRLKLVTVTDEDYGKVFWAMKNASERSGHDMAAGRAMPVPTHDDMKAAVDEIEAFRTKIRDRARQVEEDRKKLEEPPKAKIA